MRQLPYIFLICVIPIIALDPEFTIDMAGWRDPNDPFDSSRIRKTSKCDCGEEWEKSQITIIELRNQVKELESRNLKRHENFTKLVLSDILHGMNVNLDGDGSVFKRADVTLSPHGIETMRRFFNEPLPTEGLKASLQNELQNFVLEVGEEREHPYLRILREIVPYLAGANVIAMIFIIFRYNNRKMVLLMIFCGLFVNEVIRTINRKYKEAMAKRLAEDSRREQHVCAPKGYFSAAFDSMASIFVKTEDDCYKFYRESMVDVDLDVKILGSAFSVLGETFGSFFVGLSGAIREAVEDYFAPAPFYVQIIKMMVLIILLVVGLIFALKFCQFEIEIPFVKFRWHIGQGITYHNQNPAIPNQVQHQNIPNAGQIQPQLLQTPTRSALPQRSRSTSKTRNVEASTFLDATDDGTTIETDLAEIINSPNITPRTEARKRNLNSKSLPQ